MENRIKELLDWHISGNQEAAALMEEYFRLKHNKRFDVDKTSIDSLMLRLEEEITWRGVFISQLKDILSPGERINNIEVQFDENQDKF